MVCELYHNKKSKNKLKKEKAHYTVLGQSTS